MFNITSFDKYKENNRLEVKRAESGLPKSIWSTYSSFSNTLGGVILLGVIEKADRSLEPVDIKKQIPSLLDDFWNTINSNKVSVNLLKDEDVRVHQFGEYEIIEINIPMASRYDKPVYINNDMYNGSYRRNNQHGKRSGY